VDQLVVGFEGVLSYAGGFPPLAGETLTIYWDNGTHLLAIDFPGTNSTGGFVSSITFASYVLGDYDFYANYTSPDLLHNDALQYFRISRLNYTINVDITVKPNPVMQNGTITVSAYLYFAHNGTALSGADVFILWYNGTWFGLPDIITTNGTGQGEIYYSGMLNDEFRIGIEIYGYYQGSQFTDANASFPVFLTLNQWQTTFTNIILPVGPYRIGETVVATGNLEYVNGSIPYGGVTVELTLFGITRATDVTASDGSFILNWVIPGTLSPGSYDLLIEFNSPYPWIANATTVFLPINVIAPEPQFTEFSVTPATVYLDQSLTISGRVVWDNGTPYMNLPLDIYWGDYYSTAKGIIVNDFTTDGSGYFTIIFDIPDDLGLLTYVQHVWAYIDPVGYATFGESPVIPITVDIYQVSLTTSVDLTVVYLGGTLTFSGTLQFTNTTPLVGYDVEIWWGGNHLLTRTIIDPALGAFSYVHNVPYSNAIGILSGYALFRPPSLAWGDLDILEFFNDVTVIEHVDVFMDPEPADNTVSRGEILVISGNLLNDAGSAADGVTVEATVDGNPQGFSDVSAGDGSYSISLLVADNAPRGSYTVSVTITSTFHELRNGPTTWTIQVFIDSDVYVQTTIPNILSRMPGERISVEVQLTDDDGIPLFGEWVALYLGSTHIRDVQLFGPFPERIVLVVPQSWDEGNGLFNITADFGGASFINPSTFLSSNSVHVFSDPVFSYTPSRVDPGQAFTIDITIRDLAGNPVRFRQVELDFNGTVTIPYDTDAEGRFSHDVPAQSDGTVINIRITLISTEVGNILSNTFTINIQTTGGNPLQGTDLLIASILLVGAVIAVLAYLYIVRGMFRSTVISRGIDIPTKLRNIKKLADAGKYGASITLAYRTFEQMCGTKMGSERTHSETAREFLDRVLQTIPLDSMTVEQFVQTYEEARFSHHEMTRERYEEAVRIFTDLYPRIDSTAPVE
jgi:hypothetical protein